MLPPNPVSIERTWRLIQLFQGSGKYYDTIETREMTDDEAALANSEQYKIAPSKHWVR